MERPPPFFLDIFVGYLISLPWAIFRLPVSLPPLSIFSLIILLALTTERVAVESILLERVSLDGNNAFIVVEGDGIADAAVAVCVNVDHRRGCFLETAFPPAFFSLHLTIYNAYLFLLCTRLVPATFL